jgi:hypothetical protein
MNKEEINKVETFEFQAKPNNFGYQVLAFKNDSLDIIIRNNDKKIKTKYKVTIEVINDVND